jgi:hypothetical protein
MVVRMGIVGKFVVPMENGAGPPTTMDMETGSVVPLGRIAIRARRVARETAMRVDAAAEGWF